MRVVAAYYLLTDAHVRRVSREFHERVGVPATARAIYRHIRCFAFCASDRIFLLRGDHHLFHFVRTGQEHAVRVHRAGRGGIVIGAHLGSFEALRAAAEDDDLPMSIVGYFRNAAMINAMLESLDPALTERVIPIEPGHVGHVLKIRARIRAGELVAFLGDRPIPGSETVQVDFLGRPALLPTGALSLAAALGCPVLLVFSLYRDPNVYEIHCEEFAERIELPRNGGLEAKRALVQRYADRLAHYVKLAPENWANFYDFWDDPAGSG
jgi:predicted LPLAT superfamily acyltransferase